MIVWSANSSAKIKPILSLINSNDCSGAIDDIWINNDGELIVVDYKSTAGSEPVKNIDKEYHIGYKRQVEFYQWILRQMGFKVSNIAAFELTPPIDLAEYSKTKLISCLNVMPRSRALV